MGSADGLNHLKSSLCNRKTMETTYKSLSDVTRA